MRKPNASNEAAMAAAVEVVVVEDRGSDSRDDQEKAGHVEELRTMAVGKGADGCP